MANFLRLPNGALGANITDMERLATAFRTAITDIEAAFKRVDGQVGRTTWSGPDATKTEATWNQTRISVTRNLQMMLDQMSTTINTQKTQQVNAANS